MESAESGVCAWRASGLASATTGPWARASRCRRGRSLSTLSHSPAQTCKGSTARHELCFSGALRLRRRQLRQIPIKFPTGIRTHRTHRSQRFLPRSLNIPKKNKVFVPNSEQCTAHSDRKCEYCAPVWPRSGSGF